MSYDQVEALLKKKMDKKLCSHCRGTADTAARLARLYGVDPDKAYLTGLIHDYMKALNDGELLKKADEAGLLLDPLTRVQGKLLHAPVGAEYIQREMGIVDDEIIEAVRYHTTGHPEMGLFARIIYLADCIEPDRSYDRVEEVRALAEKDLNQALLLALDISIRSVIDRALLLHPDSVNFRNSILLKLL